MRQQSVDFNLIQTKMDVCDLNGETVGTVAHVYRYRPIEGEAVALNGVLVVKSGLLGLGKTLYVPTTAVDDLTTDCVVLNKAKNDPEFTEWENKPANLDETA
jgi:hypothetical protein